MKKILVVVDMQNDFIDGPLGTPEARAIVDNVCRKIREENWHKIIRTMDTHFDDYLETQEGKNLPVEHCMYKTSGWCSNEDVRVAIQEACAYIADKNGYCTSEMVKKTKFAATSLYEKFYGLKKDQTECTFVGVCTDICVISNTLLLKAHFPEMRIVVDASCCAGTTPEKHLMALSVMESCQIDVIGKE